MSAPHAHQREPALGKACRGSPPSPHTICYTEKPLNSQNSHLFPINVFICAPLWGRGLAKASRSHQGPHGYHHNSWGLLRRITLPVSSLYKSRHARLTKCFFNDSCLHIQCLRFVFQSQKKKIPKIKSGYF